MNLLVARCIYTEDISAFLAEQHKGSTLHTTEGMEESLKTVLGGGLVWWAAIGQDQITKFSTVLGCWLVWWVMGAVWQGHKFH
jgi:hypothetical protein